jgi:uncharacterized membrane protein
MQSTNRPGGLTALAVLNFIIAGLGALTALSRAAMLSMGTGSLALPPELQQRVQDMLQSGRGWLAFSAVAGLVLAVLLVLSGIGYLQQKRVLGRMVGNAYAVASIVASICSVLLTTQGIGVGAVFLLCFKIIYPVVTLALLNSVFKGNLVR